MLRVFEAFISKKGTVKTQYLPFYLKWVSDCYAFLNEPLSNRLGSEQRKQFLTNMAKRHEDWQVKQADTALRLYDYFLSKAISPTTGEPFPHEEKWRQLEEKMRDALRLRHRSLYQDHPGITRSPESTDHHDLYTRCFKERPRCKKPPR